MPFMGKDWRSPGEAWVKTESLGWQRMKLIEAQLHPSSCQTTPSPCSSWPPRSKFGQHMEQNCEQRLHSQQSTSQCRNYAGSCCSSVTSSSSESGGSRCGSESPSPNTSPEKGVNLPSVIVSSPYGQYSCCAHHFESTPGSPKSSRLSSSPKINTRSNYAQLAMTKSLSRESVNSLLEPSTSCFTKKSSNSKQLSERNNSETDLESVIEPSSVDNLNRKGEQELINRLRVKPELIDDSTVIDGYQTFEESETSLSERLKQPNETPRNDQSACCFYCKQSQNQSSRNSFVRTAPYCQISVRTREVAMYNTISEAFYRLDFCNAIHDIRRFNYICKLLHLLITQNLTSLSGCATRVLFTMLEQVAWEVSSNKRNIHVLKDLLNELRIMLQKYYCWGRPIGSSLLWQQHFDTIARISQIVDDIELAPSESETGKGVTFNNLPVEMVREILLRLNDYRDLVSSGQASPVMQNMINGQYLWKKLCVYHFSKEQIKLALENHDNLYTRQSTRRGLKYARITTADGRVSYRNQMPHKRKELKAGQQGHEESILSQHEISDDKSLSARRSDETSQSSSSLVTRTIKIFDKERVSSQNWPKEIDPRDKTTRKKGQQRSFIDQNSTQAKKQDNYYPKSTDESSRNIDWELVFHQLRKKFDLKEEYADCLLLCRHCRCLFWKSIGHPCIQEEEEQISDGGRAGLRFDNRYQPVHSAPQNFPEGRRHSGLQENNLDRESRSPYSRQDRRQPLRQQSNPVGYEQRRTGSHEDRARSRPSVAALSRSFDNRTQEQDRLPNGGNDNSAPTLNLASGLSTNQNSHVSGAQSSSLRAPPDHHNQPAQRFRFNEQALDRIGQPRNMGDAHRYRGTNELVPKHVAISPQAFLKFFSL